MDKVMIERMAKAIFTKRYQAPGTYKDLEWEKFSAKEVYLEDARQALLALREPTEAMKQAYGEFGTLDIDAYQAMIDAITGVE